MKILHIGLCVDYKNEGLPFALKEASTFYYEIAPGEFNITKRIVEAVDKHGFDLAFFQLQSQSGIHRDTIDYLRSKGIYTVEWCGDIRVDTPSFYLTRGVDLTLFSNTKDVEYCRKKGLNADFLQIGIDPKVFNKWNSDEKGNDIVFMSNNYRNQFPESHSRAMMVQFLQRQYRGKFSVYGNGWQSATGENNSDQVRQSNIYNNSKIAINYSQFNSDRYTSDRMFRILASGCFCLSHHYRGIEKDFEVGKHLDTFKTLQELRQKIDYYLTNEEKRNEIARQGYEYCHENFTYFNMVQNLIKLYNDQNKA